MNAIVAGTVAAAALLLTGVCIACADRHSRMAAKKRSAGSGEHGAQEVPF